MFNWLLKLYSKANKQKECLELVLSDDMKSIRNNVSYLFALKACTSMKDTVNGGNILKEIWRNNYMDIQIKTEMINYYGNIKYIEKARDVFDKIENKNTVVYNAMMKAYINNKMYQETIDMLLLSDDEFKKSYVSYILGINACTYLKDTINGHRIYNQIKDRKYSNIEVHNALISYFGATNNIEDVMLIYNGMRNKDVVSYNATMKAYMINQMNQKALDMFLSKNMEELKDAVSYTLGLNACIHLKDKVNGDLICSQVMKRGFNEIELKTTMMNYYGITNNIEETNKIFNGIKNKNVIVYNSIMKAYTNNDMNEEALNIFFDKRIQHIRTSVSYNIALNASIALKDMKRCQIIYEQIKSKGFKDLELMPTVMHYLSTINDIQSCKNIFDEIKNKNIIVYNSMLQAYFYNEMYQEFFELFFSKDLQNIKTIATYIIGLNACINVNHKDNGYIIYNQVCNEHFDDVVLNTTLINLFGNFEDMEKVKIIFDGIKDKNIVTYNSMLKAYLHNELYREVLNLFFSEEMTDIRDSISCVYGINACTQLKDKHYGETIYNEIISKNYNSKELSSAMIDYFGTVGDIEKAQIIFDSVADKDITQYNSMMQIYRINECYQDAINIFNDAFNNTVLRSQMDEYTYSIALYCCADMGSVKEGDKIIHELKDGTHNTILKHINVQCGMIIYYGKCSNISMALDLFQNMETKTTNKNDVLLLYASMMNVYAKNGDINQVLNLFNQLRSKNIKGNNSIYCIIINACSHAGNINYAHKLFNEVISYPKNINNSYLITCIIDCLSRNNDMSNAQHIYNKYAHNNKNIYYKDKIKMLKSILSQCKAHNNIKLAENILQICENIYISNNDSNIDSYIYIIMANIYGTNKEFDKKQRIFKKMESYQKMIKHSD